MGGLDRFLGKQQLHKGIDERFYYKEALHLTILGLIGRDRELLDGLTFQGGTALRLCYGLNRLSEDLDFVAGKDEKVLVQLGERLKHLLKKDIPEVSVKEKRTDYLYVLRLRGEGKRREVKIEIARVPAYTSVFCKVHSDLFKQTPTIWINVETREEILADKIVAMGLRQVSEDRPFKARDIWDLHWLVANKIETELSMILKKVEDYGKDTDYFVNVLSHRLELMRKEEAMRFFVDEMSRFLYGEELDIFLEHSDRIASVMMEEVYSYLGGWIAKLKKNKHRNRQRSKGFGRRLR